MFLRFASTAALITFRSPAAQRLGCLPNQFGAAAVDVEVRRWVKRAAGGNLAHPVADNLIVTSTEEYRYS
jgi:hypothetical protein